MPIIASQHAWKDADHTPSDRWPEDCTVQWGRNGLVIGNDGKKSYKTAFFEAFPKHGGFIRGEGSDLAAAEESAFSKFLKISACDHLWGRGKYTNGGAICRRCGAFESRFHAIPKLGAFRDPLDAMTLDMIAEGYMRPTPDDPKGKRYARRAWLKARRMGIDLPDFDTAPPPPGGFELDEYAKTCRKAVAEFLIAHEDLLNGSKRETATGLEGFFLGMHSSSLRRLIEEYRSDQGEAPDAEQESFEI